MSERRPMFPLQSRGYPGIPSEIPWAIVANYGESAMRNHDQTLERLAERGGLSPCELIAVLEQRQWRKMTPDEVRSTLLPILSAHNSLAIDRDVWKARAEALQSETHRWSEAEKATKILHEKRERELIADRNSLRAALRKIAISNSSWSVGPLRQIAGEALAASEAKEAKLNQIPNCPNCGRQLEKLIQYASDKVKLGDWFCYQCPKASSKYTYFWNKNLAEEKEAR